MSCGGRVRVRKAAYFSTSPVISAGMGRSGSHRRIAARSAISSSASVGTKVGQRSRWSGRKAASVRPTMKASSRSEVVSSSFLPITTAGIPDIVPRMLATSRSPGDSGAK